MALVCRSMASVDDVVDGVITLDYEAVALSVVNKSSIPLKFKIFQPTINRDFIGTISDIPLNELRLNKFTSIEILENSNAFQMTFFVDQQAML